MFNPRLETDAETSKSDLDLVNAKSSDNVPELFKSTAKLSACYTGTERIITDADLLIDDVIRKVVSPTSHRTNKHGNVMCLWNRRQLSRQPYGL